jgi:hypothetical protein
MIYPKYFTFVLELASLLHIAICVEMSKPLNVSFTLGFVHCLYNTSKIYTTTHMYIHTYIHTYNIHTYIQYFPKCVY